MYIKFSSIRISLFLLYSSFLLPSRFFPRVETASAVFLFSIIVQSEKKTITLITSRQYVASFNAKKRVYSVFPASLLRIDDYRFTFKAVFWFWLVQGIVPGSSESSLRESLSFNFPPVYISLTLPSVTSLHSHLLFSENGTMHASASTVIDYLLESIIASLLSLIDSQCYFWKRL